MLSVAAVQPDDGGLVTIGGGIRAGPTERLCPIRGEPLDMPGMETVAERMADYFVGHHPTMPRLGEPAQALVATHRFEDSLHASMMPIAPSLCNEDAIGPENVEQAAQLIFSALWPLRTKCSSLRTVSASMVLVNMYQWMVNSGEKSRPSVPTTAPEISSRLWAWLDFRTTFVFEEHKRTLDSDCYSRRRPSDLEKANTFDCETVNSPERSTYGVASSAAKMLPETYFFLWPNHLSCPTC